MSRDVISHTFANWLDWLRSWNKKSWLTCCWVQISNRFLQLMVQVHKECLWHLLVAVPDSHGVATVNRGDALILPCHLPPSANVTWVHLEKLSRPNFFMYRSGKVDMYLKYRVKVIDPTAGNFSLLHSNVQKDDAGRYICCQENTACSDQIIQFFYTVFVNGMCECLSWSAV